MTEKQIKETDLQRVNRFHKHLDECSQCRNHPFGLCHKGAVLLKYAATKILDDGEVIHDRR